MKIVDTGEDFITPEFLNILFFQQRNLVIYPYVDLKHLHTLEIFTVGYSNVDLESTALHDLKRVLEFESENSYSQSPSFYFIYNLGRSNIKEVLSMDSIRCVLNSNENISDLADSRRFIFYNKKNNHFLNYAGGDLEFETNLISMAKTREILNDSIQKIKSTASLIFSELNSNNSFENLPDILKDYNSKYWQKILKFTENFFEIKVPRVEDLDFKLESKVDEKDDLKDFSDEYEVIVSTNKSIGKEFIQCLHEYRSKKVNASHLELEDMFNPLRLYNYLRNRHWKEGIPEMFIKEWGSMSRSQYNLTEIDHDDFERIFKKLNIPLVQINYRKENKLEIKKVNKVSSSIKRLENKTIPFVKDFSAFKEWIFETLDGIENLLGIQPNSSIKKLAGSRFSNSTKNPERVFVDLTNILMADVNKNRNMQMKNVLLIREQILSEGYHPILVTDANTLYNVDDEGGFRKLVKEGVIRQAPADRKADIFVLKLARNHNCRFITNDKYSDPKYKEEFGKEWIRKNRITFIFADGVLVLD